MAASSKPKSGSGCFSTLILLILLLGAVGLGAAVFFIAQPQDLSDLGGYGPAAKVAPVRDLKAVLKNSMDRGFPLTLSEADINNWLGKTLITKQGGLLGSQIPLERVWVRLEEGYAEVIMERKIMSQPFTISMFVKVEKMEGPKGVVTEVKLDGGPYHADVPQPPRGGRFGRLVVPQGFLILILPAYQKLAALFPDEKNLAIEEMARIKFEKGHIILNPRAPEGSDAITPQTF